MNYLRFIFILFIFSCSTSVEANKQTLIDRIIKENSSFADSSKNSFLKKIGDSKIFPESLQSITNQFVNDTQDNKKNIFQKNLEKLNVLELQEILTTQAEVKKFNKPLELNDSLMGVLGSIFTSNPFSKEKQVVVNSYLKNSKKSEMIDKIMSTSSLGAFSSILPKELTAGLLGEFGPLIKKANQKRKMALIYNQFKDVPIEEIERLDKLVSSTSYSHLINSEIEVMDSYPKLFTRFFEELKKIAPSYLKNLQGQFQ